jgi:hypothetical protein
MTILCCKRCFSHFRESNFFIFKKSNEILKIKKNKKYFKIYMKHFKLKQIGIS